MTEMPASPTFCTAFSRGVLILLAAAWNLQGEAQAPLPYDISIANFYGGRPGAISITFDDACYSQYTEAYPFLQRLNLRATFGVVGEWAGEEPAVFAEKGFFGIQRMGWKQLVELQGQGHELAAHGFLHERYDPKAPVPELAREMRKVRQLIEDRTGKPVFTLNYPYSYASANIPPAARVAGYLFGRSGLDTLNASEPGSMFLLASRAILSDTLPDSATFAKWLDQASGKWLILMYHHILAADSKEMELFRNHRVTHTYTVSPGTFQWQVNTAVASGCWIAPVSAIGKYIMERQRTELKIRIRRHRARISTTLKLDGKVYDQELTLAVRVPWKKVRIKGSSADGIFANETGILYVDFKPGATIFIQQLAEKP